MQFTQKQQCSLSNSCLKQPNIERFVRLGIDRGIQPLGMIIDPNQFVNCDLVRSRLQHGSYILHTAANRCPTTFDIPLFKHLLRFENGNLAKCK